MSSKGSGVVWLKLRKGSGRGFHLRFPIAMYVFRELLDSVLDIVALACVFVPKRKNSPSGMSVHAIRELLLMLTALLGSITEDGPYDLVDVTADNVEVQIKIR